VVRVGKTTVPPDGLRLTMDGDSIAP
jgi:hypothetical protein